MIEALSLPQDHSGGSRHKAGHDVQGGAGGDGARKALCVGEGKATHWLPARSFGKIATSVCWSIGHA